MKERDKILRKDCEENERKLKKELHVKEIMKIWKNKRNKEKRNER